MLPLRVLRVFGGHCQTHRRACWRKRRHYDEDMTATLRQFFARLPGAWTVTRTIDDSRLGTGRFTGQAVFAPNGDGALLYAENGELTLGDWKGPAYRRWLYTRQDNALCIYYPDGSVLLHRFPFAADSAHAMHTHFCAADRYEAEIQLLGGGRYALNYAVYGPSKEYMVRTVYEPRRAAGTGAAVAH